MSVMFDGEDKLRLSVVRSIQININKDVFLFRC